MRVRTKTRNLLYISEKSDCLNRHKQISYLDKRNSARNIKRIANKIEYTSLDNNKEVKMTFQNLVLVNKINPNHITLFD